MNYKIKNFQQNEEAAFSKLDDNEEEEEMNADQFDGNDQYKFENLFQSIDIACKNANDSYLVELFLQLTQEYSDKKTCSSEIALEYCFISTCSSLLTMCANDEVIISMLNCIYFAIHSDPGMLELFSNPTFCEQLANCIDEKGSCIYEPGFEILSEIIQGYSQPLFSKICYIFGTTPISKDDFTEFDIKNLNSFGKVFTQISEFATDRSYLIMLLIAKIFLYYGVFNYGINILNNIVKLHDNAANKIFTLDKLEESQLSEIGEINFSFYQNFTKEDSDNNFESVDPSIFSILVKSIPHHKDRSELFNFDYEKSLINTLELIVVLIQKWGGHYRYALNSIDIDFLFELMNYKDNMEIQNLSLSIFAEIYCKDKQLTDLIHETENAIAAIESFAANIEDMPFSMRASSLKGICKIIEAITKINDLELKSELFDKISQYNLLDKIVEFFFGDSRSQIESAYAIWILIDNFEEAKNQCLEYLEDFETMEMEEQDPSMRGQLHLINIALKKENDSDFF